MKKVIKAIIVNLILLIISLNSYAQINSCIDLNNRVIYSFPFNSILYSNPVPGHNNYIMGRYNQPVDTGIVLAKTYLDTILWVKKFRSAEKTLTIANAIFLPDSSIIANSATYAGKDLFLVRFSKYGAVLWSKKYNLSIPNSLFVTGNQTNTLLEYKNGFIYCATNFSVNTNRYLSLLKLRLDGNIVWSKTFSNNDPVFSYFANPPAVINDTIICVANLLYRDVLGNIDSVANVITKLNSTSGNVISSTRIKTVPHQYIKGLTVFNTKINPDNSLTIAGTIGIQYIPPKIGIATSESIPFVVILNENYTAYGASYYSFNSKSSNTRLDGTPSSNTSINSTKQTSFLFTDISTQLAYNLNIDSNLNIMNTKAFYANTRGYFATERSLKLMDNGSTVYGFSFFNGNNTELEYFNIASSASFNSLNCFGRDTAIFQKNNFSITADTFVWPNQFDNIVASSDFFLTETGTNVTSQVICTQTSICDSIKIKGNTKYCLPYDTTTFTLYKNVLCQRKVNWLIDTTAVKIISQPNDTTIKVKFLRSHTGYIQASFEGCVLKDSLFIEVTNPKQSLFLGRDSILCTGKTITLNPGTGFKTYKWQDYSTNSIYIANAPGLYFAEVTDSCDNIFKDSINILPMDATFNLLSPGLICQYDTVALKVNTELYDITWSPSADGLFQNNYLKFFPATTTLFNLTATRFEGCQLTDTVLIKVENCPVYIYIPNAFSPNNDGKNDNFKPLISGRIITYQLNIYNRLGQLIFASNNTNKSWDGTIKGLAQNSGVFVWTCSYKFANQPTVFKKGTVMLIR